MNKNIHTQTPAHAEPVAAAAQAITRRRALVLLPAAALGLAAVLALPTDNRQKPVRGRTDRHTSQIPHDTLIHGAGWCIPH